MQSQDNLVEGGPGELLVYSRYTVTYKSKCTVNLESPNQCGTARKGAQKARRRNKGSNEGMEPKESLEVIGTLLCPLHLVLLL